MKIFIPTPEELAPKPVEAGIYKATISGTKVRNTQKGDIAINVEYTLQGDDVQGRKVFDNMMFTENTLWRTVKVYKAITNEDLPSREWEIDELINFVTSKIQNKEVLVKVEVKSIDGNVRNEVRDVIAIKN